MPVLPSDNFNSGSSQQSVDTGKGSSVPSGATFKRRGSTPVRSVYCSGDRPAPSRTSPSMTSFLPTTEQPVHSESGRRRRVSALCKDMGSTY